MKQIEVRELSAYNPKIKYKRGYYFISKEWIIRNTGQNTLPSGCMVVMDRKIVGTVGTPKPGKEAKARMIFKVHIPVLGEMIWDNCRIKAPNGQIICHLSPCCVTIIPTYDTVDNLSLASLIQIGFSEKKARRALLGTSGFDEAVRYLIGDENW